MNYQSTFFRYPSGADIGQGAGWSAHILPQIDQGVIASKIIYQDESVGERDLVHWGEGAANDNVKFAGNYEACRTVLSVFRCPSDPREDTFPSGGGARLIEDRAASSYLGCASGTVNVQADLVLTNAVHKSPCLLYTSPSPRDRG